MLNHIDLMGRLTKDPEIRYTQSNVPVASFTLACDRDFKGQDGQRETDFVDCTAWRQTAEFVGKYFPKGTMAVVSGRLQSRHWEKDGQKRVSWEVLVDNIYFGQTKSNDGQQTQRTPTSPAQPAPVQSTFHDLNPEDDGDLPF